MILTRRRCLILAATLPALAARAADAAEIRQPIVDLYSALDKSMRSGTSVPFKARYDALAPVIDRTFDLSTILRVSVGTRWSALDQESRDRLLELFRSYTIASYVANFDKSDGEHLEVGTDLRSVGEDQVVPTRIIPRNGSATKLDFLMRQSASGWRVVDVLAEGTISRVAVQRSDFRTLLGSKGDPTPLIDNLRRKVADLSGGTLS